MNSSLRQSSTASALGSGNTEAGGTGETSTHTPGPWTWSERGYCEYACLGNEGGEYVLKSACGITDNGLRASSWIMCRPKDARLIAAAPDFYAACKAFVADEDRLIADLRSEGRDPADLGFPFPLVDAMRAAIAKAEGRAPPEQSAAAHPDPLTSRASVEPRRGGTNQSPKDQPA